MVLHAAPDASKSAISPSRWPAHLQLLSLCAWLVLTSTLHAQLIDHFAPPSAPVYSASNEDSLLLAIADLKGGGNPDIIVQAAISYKPYTAIEVFPNLGGGKFGNYKIAYKPPTGSYLAGNVTGGAASGDFNGDGLLDFVSLTGEGQVQLLLGEQDETFSATAAGATVCPSYCDAAVVGDFNGDGKLDVALWSPNSARFVVLPGHGDGTFGTPVITNNVPPAGNTNYGVLVAADFNRDGRLDLALSVGNGNVRTFKGDGKGGFTQGASIDFSAITSTVGMGGLVAVDLRGDGKVDLVATNNGDQSDRCPGTGLFVAQGNGDGTFDAPQTYNIGEGPGAPVVGDLNGDGKPDLVVANGQSFSISILLNNGTGGLLPAMSYKTGSFGMGVLVGDVNGDHRPDIIDSSINGPSVNLTLPGGKLNLPSALEINAYSEAITAPADLNDDGIADVLAFASPQTASCMGGNTRTYLHPILSSNGVGLSNYPTPFAGPPATASVGLGYFNTDGLLDAVALGTYSSPPNDIEVYLNNGKGDFSTSTRNFMDTTATAFAAGDFNRDGKSDLALLSGNTVDIGLGKGGESFGASTSYDVGSEPVYVTQRDLNHDGKADLVVVNQGSNSVSVLLGNGDGTFQPQAEYSVGTVPFGVAYADFNDDGNLDLAIGDPNGVSILLNKGNGTFGSQIRRDGPGIGVSLSSIAATDFRGNGIADVAAGTGNGYLFLFAGNGNGTLEAAEVYQSQGSYLLQAGDFNGDGAPDLILSGFPGGPAPNLTVLYNQGGTRITLMSSRSSITVGQSVTFTATVIATTPGSGTPSGEVSFKDGSAALGTVSLNEGAADLTTSKLAKGTRTITASYAGAGVFNPHLSEPVTVQVNP
jgi:hypothetical protein